jgi:hypothetical protein
MLISRTDKIAQKLPIKVRYLNYNGCNHVECLIYILWSEFNLDLYNFTISIKKLNLILEQAMKDQKRIRGIVLPFL